MSELVDKRTFFLTLSVAEGQHIAHGAGFSIPSEDVQKSEILDVVRKWIILSGSGILNEVSECADWLLQVVDLAGDNDEDEELEERTRDILKSFGVALLGHLIDNDKIQLSPDLTFSQENSIELISDLFSVAIDDEDPEEEEEE